MTNISGLIGINLIYRLILGEFYNLDASPIFLFIYIFYCDFLESFITFTMKVLFVFCYIYP